MEYVKFLDIGIELKDKVSKNEYSFVKDLSKRYNLKIHDNVWCKVSLDSLQISDFLDELRELNKKGVISFRDAFLDYKLISETEWFQLVSNDSSLDAYDEDYKLRSVRCHAYKYPKYCNVDVYSNNSGFIFSEKLVDLIKDNNLSGIDFLWVNDIGKYKPNYQWFYPIVFNPIGRGLDDEWIDIEKMKKRKDYIFSMGRNEFHSNNMSSNSSLSDVEKKIFSLFRDDNYIKITKQQRFDLKFLPDNDFAYGWNISDDHRTIYVNNKTRNIMLKSGLVNEKQFQSIDIIDKPKYSEDNFIKPGPYYNGLSSTFDEAKRISILNYHNYLEKSKPEFKITNNALKQLLKRLKKDNVKFYNKPLSHMVVNDYSVIDSWIEILKISDGFYLDELDILSYSEIRKLTNDFKNALLDDENALKYDNYLVIGVFSDGDYCILENEIKDNVKVLRISHEDYTEQEVWDSIILFLYDKIS